VAAVWFQDIPHCYKAYNFNQDLMHMRIMPLMQKSDLILLQRNAKEAQKFFHFCAPLFSLNPKQMVLFEPTTDGTLSKDTITLLTSKMSPTHTWHLSAYATTPDMIALADTLNISLNADPTHIVDMLGSKDFLIHNSDINTPHGYICHTREELHDAYSWFAHKKKRALLKSHTSTGGRGIIELIDHEQIQKYTFTFGPVVVQELHETDCYDDGSPCTLSVQFEGQHILGVTDQHVQNFAFKGSTFPSRAPLHIQDHIHTIVASLIKKYHIRGPGGCDFIVVNGTPLLVDINIGRMTGVHPAWWFRRLYAPNASFKLYHIHHNTTLHNWWSALKKAQKHFDTTKHTGIVPLAYSNKNTLFVLELQ
jgi:hypothetical protein